MIDLSFLTEEEQEAILTVLKRDAELKKAEEQRVQKLQQNIADKGQLKYLTGEWFYETKQLRHQERIHGTDIIWASMKHTHKPMTILELSQIAPERPSFVNSGNKEVFVPPVLSELLQEPLTQTTQPRNQRDPEVEKPYELQESLKPLVQSPTRQRRNPFNSGPDEAVFTQDNGQLTEGAVQQSNSQMDEYILPTDLINPYGTLQNLHPSNPFYAIPQKSVLTPVPEESMYEDETAEVYGPEDRQSNSVSPRGILKYMLSPTDSPDLGLQSSVIAESPVEAWTDRKQVRFSSAVSSSSVKRQDGKELGEHSLLDVDLIIPSENNSEAENRNTSNSKESEVFVQDGSQQQVLGDHSETCQAEAQKQVSIIISTNQESGKIHMETQADEEAAPQIQSNEKQLTNESSKKSPHAISPKPKQRLFGLFRREKRKNKEDVKESEQKDMQTDNVNLSQAVVETKNEEEKLTEESVSDLKAFWERENIGISARDEKDANIHSPEKTNVETIECNQDGKEKEIASKFPEEIQSVESKFLVEVSQEDCTYRAFPVLIFEDNDDSIICSIPESQICQPKQSPEPLPQQLTESKPTNVGELKSFWESTSAPCSPVRSCKVSELKTSTDTQKKDDVPLSPSKKPIVVNEKGFVGQGIERLPSKGGIGDVHKTWHQVKEGANSQDRPYSPSRSPSKRSKDQDDEVRRSPSKTCHPRVLPRESASSPQGSRPGSPFRTFPIVIDPEDQLVKPTSLQKQKKSPSHETKATMDSATDICSPKIPRSPEKTPLVRSIVPQDYQHYLGPREQAHLPPCPQTDTAQDTNTLQSPVRESTGRQSGSLPKDPRVSSWIEQIKDCSEEDNTTRAWTLSHASSGSEMTLLLSPINLSVRRD